MGPGGLRGLQVALARDRVPILYYETPPDGSEGSFDSADMGSMIWIDKLSHGGFANAKSLTQRYVGEPLIAHGRSEGNFGGDDGL